MSLDDSCQADKPRAPKAELHDDPPQGFEGTLGEVLAKSEGSWGQDWLSKHRKS